MECGSITIVNNNDTNLEISRNAFNFSDVWFQIILKKIVEYCAKQNDEKKTFSFLLE